MNHTRLSCQHGAVLARHSQLQDTRVSLFSTATPASAALGRGDSQGSSEGWRWDLLIQHLLI